MSGAFEVNWRGHVARARELQKTRTCHWYAKKPPTGFAGGGSITVVCRFSIGRGLAEVGSSDIGAFVGGFTSSSLAPRLKALIVNVVSDDLFRSERALTLMRWRLSSLRGGSVGLFSFRSLLASLLVPFRRAAMKAPIIRLTQPSPKQACA